MVSLMDQYKGDFKKVCEHYAKHLYNKGLLKKTSIDDFVKWMQKSEEYFGKNIATAELYHHAYLIYKKINNPKIKQHHIIVASGKIGKGKTTILSQICALVDPTFCGERVYYVPNMFFRGMRKTKPGQAHLIDEGGNFFKALNTMGKTSKLLGQYLQMMRSKRLLLAIAYDDYKRMNKEVKEKIDSLIIKIPNNKKPIPEAYASWVLIPNDTRLANLNEIIEKKKLDLNIAIRKTKAIYGTHSPDFPVINDLDETKFNEWKDKNREAFERTFEEESKMFEVEQKNNDDPLDDTHYIPAAAYAKRACRTKETIKTWIKQGKLKGMMLHGQWVVNADESPLASLDTSDTPEGGDSIFNKRGGEA